jgi:hypothetical protein
MVDDEGGDDGVSFDSTDDENEDNDNDDMRGPKMPLAANESLV